jgi:hypothetical protein
MEAIQKGFFAATKDRVEQEARVIVAQDTTDLDFTSHRSGKGFGYLEQPWCQGIKVHSALAISDAGVPLGLLDQQVWTRSPEEYGKTDRRKTLPTSEKESQRWLNVATAVQERVSETTEVIIVGDRESDIFDLFAQQRRRGINLLVRCARNRVVSGRPHLLFDQVLAAPVAEIQQIEVPRQHRQPARKAK